MRETGFHPRFDRALIAVFLLMLVLPPLGTIAGLQRATPEEENRPLASFPTLQMTWASWRAFPDAFTRYFEDNFAFRPALVRWQAAARVKALGVSPSTAVVKGRDGWWFYADDGAMQDYAEVRPFTVEELEGWRHALQDTSDWLAARGIAYLFVLAPDKHQVYPEYMPAAIRPAGRSRIDQLVEHLGRYSTVRVLDLRPALERAKAGDRIYHRTDTHWNELGAFAAYTAIVDALSQARPDLRPMPPALFSPHHVRSDGLDLARMMRLTHVLEEDDVTLEWRRPRQASVVEPLQPNPNGIDARIVTTAPDAALPRAVVFRDSFASAVIPFLAEHFSRALYLWQHNVDPAAIDAERPDVVVHEIVGRRLSTLTPYNPFAEPGSGDVVDGFRSGSE
jgi:hypothetical protein